MPNRPLPITRRRSCYAWLLAAAAVGVSGGCAAFGMRSPEADALARCRDYACRGATALEIGKWGQAEQLLRKAVEESPTDAMTRRHLAETLWQQGQQAEAVAHLRLAVEREPTDASSTVRLGEMLLARRELIEARELAERAVALDDKNPRAWALRGRAHHELGDPERGLADLHNALRLAPDEREVLSHVARIYSQRGMPRRQLTTLHRLADTYPPGEAPPGLLADEGAAYLALGRPQLAVERLRMAAASGKGDARLLYRLATAEEAAGHADRARFAAEQALVADASHTPSQQMLARLSTSGVAAAGLPAPVR
ncbi:MAG: tetratricopeptide repeat protein [Planctomycetota bacterium]